TLERDYEVVLSMQELRSLTIGNLTKIGGQDGSKNLTFSSPEQSPAKLELSYPSLTLPIESIVKLNDVHEGRPVFFLPPIEGSFSLLESLAKHIKRPVLGINWTVALREFDTIEQTSQYFIQLAKQHITDNT